jgi:pyruvate formate lyase activating enzyme
MQINGFNKTTLLDYPGHLAATIFLGSCDFRCPFCHNASLVISPMKQPCIPTDEILAVLIKRKNVLEGVCISGGEPTLQDDLPSFIEQIKKLNLKVKLDTNGNNPTMIQELIDHTLIDYIAMDIKNSKDNYIETIGKTDFSNSSTIMNHIEKSVDIIKSSTIDYEFRTTVVKELHSDRNFVEIGKWIQGARKYFLQSYIDSGNTIQSGFSAYSKPELEHFKTLVEPYVNTVEIRGID